MLLNKLLASLLMIHGNLFWPKTLSGMMIAGGHFIQKILSLVQIVVSHNFLHLIMRVATLLSAPTIFLVPATLFLL